MDKERREEFKKSFKTYQTVFETKEFVEGVDENVKLNPEDSFLVNKNQRVWLKENKPSIVEEINSQLRIFFNIPKTKYIFRLYYPPSNSTKTTVLKELGENISTRIVISTIDENPEIFVNNKSIGKKMIQGWSAYEAPSLINNMLSYWFDNKNHITVETKSGFRSARKSKKVKERYILVFDYIFSNKDLENVTDYLKKYGSVNKNDKNIEDALDFLTKK